MSKLTIPVRPQDHVRGPNDARVTLVEYGDFECPHCGRAHGVLNRIQNELGPQLRLVFRHFPLTSIHPHAEAAALAAEAADAQGKFWEMHDALFEHQEALEDGDLRKYAESLDLDAAKFARSLRSREFLARIKGDIMSGVRSGVNGTPTFFIDGVRHDGSPEYAPLSEALRRAAEAKLAS
jgi:protein-disulfide isomerase